MDGRIEHERGLVSGQGHGEDPEYLETLALDLEDRLPGLPDAIDVYGPGPDFSQTSMRGARGCRRW